MQVVRKVLGFAAAAVALVALVSVVLTVALLASSGQLNRLVDDVRRLRAAGQWTDLDAQAAFASVYGDVLGTRPDPPRLHSYYEQALSREGPVVFDQAMAAYALDRYGQVDSRVLPAGVYVGMRSIGPDHPPLVGAAKYIFHYGFFPRHSFLLVVTPPAQGRHRQAVTLSAGPKEDFVPAAEDGMAAYAIVHPYRPGEYDFPNEGQAIHELFLLSSDAAAAERAAQRLETAARVFQESGTGYRLVSVNSNTVIGCLLRRSDAVSPRQEAALGEWPVALRAIGVSFKLPLPAAAISGSNEASSTETIDC